MSNQIHLENPRASRSPLRRAKLILFSFFFILFFSFFSVAKGAVAAPVITSATTARGTVGSAFSYQITATNAPTSYGATGLPAGLTVNSGTGLISGTPTAKGKSTVTLSATNSGGTGNATLTLTIILPFVQAVATAASGTANSLSLSFPQNTVKGDLLVVGFDFNAKGAASSVTDSQGNTFTQVGTPLTSPGGNQSQVYCAKNIPGGADTVTVNLSANSAVIELYLTEYSGMDQTHPIDAQAGASGNAGSVSSGDATTTYAGDVIYGYCLGDSACTVGSGFVARSTFNSNLLEDKTAGNPGPYASTGTANAGWTMQMVALKLASSGTVTAPVASLSPSSLTFASQAVGSTSAAQTVTLSNTGNLALTISSIALAGTNPSDFAQTNTCGSSVAAGGNCTISVTFKPTASGTRTATVTFTDNASGSPQSVSLTGTGTAPVTSLSPTTLTFASQAVSSTSAAQTITLSNTGNAALTLTSLALTGANPGDFAQSNNCGASVAAAANCTISVTFKPTASGSRTAAVSVTDNASGSPQSVILSGTATLAPPVITSTATASGTVGSAFSYLITATNAPNSYGATGLPAGLTVNSATGLISGAPASAGTSTVSLSATNSGGTGSASLTLTVNATAPVITSASTASGTQGSAFSYQIAATNSPTSYGAAGLPAGLTVNTATGLISGTPTAAGTSTVTLSATNSGGTGTATLTLTIYVPPPVITSATTASGTVGSAFSYQITALNTPSSYGTTGLPAGLSVNSATGLMSGTPASAGTSTVTLSATNSGGTGSASLTLTVNAAPPVITCGTTANGTAGSTFSYQITATNSPTSYGATALPAGLAVSSTTGVISGTPTSAGTSTVTLSATNSGGTGNASLTLTVSAAAPVASLSPSSLTFTSQTVGVVSGAQTISLSNTGNTTLTLTSIALTGANPGDFAQSNNCGASVAAGANCTISVTFEPTATGVRTASVNVTDNAPGSPQTVNLSGTGTSTGSVSLSPSSLTFGSCPAMTGCSLQTAVLTNNGSSALSISSITFTGANPADYTENNTCSSSVAAGGSCNIVVLFTPSASGSRTASLSVSDNASGSPQTVSLSGTGTHDVVLAWSASPTTGIPGYNVYRGTSAGGEISTPLNSAPIGGTTYTDDNVTSGTTYYYLVTAVASNGSTQSANSNEASATVPSP